MRSRSPFDPPYRRVRGAFQRFFSELVGREPPPDAEAEGDDPDVHFREDDEAFHVEVDVPGCLPGDLEVTLTGRDLSVRSMRGSEQERKRNGPDVKRIRLPAGADPEGLAATLDRGVLHLSVAKSPALKPRKIEIRTPEGPFTGGAGAS
jgi:HSP20 family protein